MQLKVRKKHPTHQLVHVCHHVILLQSAKLTTATTYLTMLKGDAARAGNICCDVSLVVVVVIVVVGGLAPLSVQNAKNRTKQRERKAHGNKEAWHYAVWLSHPLLLVLHTVHVHHIPAEKGPAVLLCVVYDSYPPCSFLSFLPYVVVVVVHSYTETHKERDPPAPAPLCLVSYLSSLSLPSERAIGLAHHY